MARRRDGRPRQGQQGHREPRPTPSSTPASPASYIGEQAPRPDDRAAALQALRTQIEEIRRDMNARLDALAAAVESLLPAAPAAIQALPAPRQPSAKPIAGFKPGDEVYVPRLGGTYTVVEGPTLAGTFKVQAGPMRVELSVDEVWALDAAAASRQAAQARAAAARAGPNPDPAIPSIDLHGYSEQDALITLELFLHHTYAQRTPRVRIIHGKGNGILREAVRRELTRSPLVRAVDTGPHFRGDDGVTLADLDL